MPPAVADGISRVSLSSSPAGHEEPPSAPTVSTPRAARANPGARTHYVAHITQTPEEARAGTAERTRELADATDRVAEIRRERRAAPSAMQHEYDEMLSQAQADVAHRRDALSAAMVVEYRARAQTTAPDLKRNVYDEQSALLQAREVADSAQGTYRLAMADARHEAMDAEPANLYEARWQRNAQIWDAEQTQANLQSRFGGTPALRPPAAGPALDPSVADASNPLPTPGGLWVVGHRLALDGRQMLIDNPILEKQWDNTTSAWTGRDRFSQPMQDHLQARGIRVEPEIHPVPPGSASRNSGVSPGVANNINGDKARDAIAQTWRDQGFKVDTEQERLGGARKVDVVVHVPARDPRQARTLEIESKAGYRTLDAEVRAQAELDTLDLRTNAGVRHSGQVLETVGKVARPVGVVLDAVEVGHAFHADGNRVGLNTGRAASGVAGGALGAWGGAAAGAAIGSVVPGVGTVVGGVVGGVVGAFGGDAIGRGLFDTVRGWF
jgi:hypothetical protein